MKAKDLRDMTAEELKAREAELRQEHFNLRFQHGTRQLDNTSGLKRVRRDIARVLTILTDKERENA